MIDKIKVIYISGLGRSGSTLLDLIISTSEDVFSIGEIYRFNELRRENIECSCGKKFNQCEFWKKFYEDRINIINRMNLKDYLKMVNFLFNPFSKKIKFKKQSQDSQLYRKIKEELPDKNKYILDSSKDIARLIELDSSLDLDVYNISIIRDGRAVANSFNSKKQSGKKKNFFISLLKWNFVNLVMLRYLKKRNKNLIISYDKFCKNPNKYIRTIENFLGIKIPRDYLDKLKHMKYHNIGGNRIASYSKRKEIDSIRNDDKWKKRQNLFNKLVGTLISYPLNKTQVYKYKKK